jgi:integral membrane sensor domain MASE1
VAVLAAVYFTAAALGLSLATMHANVSLVWPPTGIALAALLHFGYRLWPGVALGAFLVNASTDVSLATAAGIAAGNTLEALAGAWLLRRVLDFRVSFERVPDVLGFVACAAGLSTTVSATIGVASLGLSGSAPWTLYWTLWWQWWLGDAMGDLVVAPVLLTWRTPALSLARWRRQVAEAVALLVSLVAVGEVVFGGWLATETVASPLAYAVFPFVIWAALRFGQPGATMATLVASAIAIQNTVRAVGPFLGKTPTESLMLLQMFMGVIAVTALILAAAMTQRRRLEAALREAEMLRYVTTLAAAAAHEINNPLTAVRGHLELLASRTEDAATRERVGATLGGVTRIQEIVQRMGHITRLKLSESWPGLPDMLDLHESSGAREEQRPPEPR